MLFASFTNQANANSAIDALETQGFSAKNISVITKDMRGKSSEAVADNITEGTTSGAVTGGVIGGIAGILAGAGVVPALAGLLIGGPIAAALGATGVAAAAISGAVTGVVAGGLIGALASLGVSEEDARYYDETVSKGGVLVAVSVNGNGEEARDILEENGAGRISSVPLKEPVAAM